MLCVAQAAQNATVPCMALLCLAPQWCCYCRAREALSSIADDHVRLHLHAWVYNCYMLLGLCAKAFEQQQSTAGSRAAAGRQRARRGLGGARRTGRGASEVDAAASAQLGLDALHTQQQLLQAISPGSSELAALSARYAQ